MRRLLVHLPLTLHLELAPGFLSVRLTPRPRPGARVVDGDTPGTLHPCPLCTGQGLLFHPDNQPVSTPPSDG